ncbi:hypothetical protein FOCC_FOCC000580 [Frankliniella occidentalis]|nr:hypothetical protein FOCC_FOCC000580 [Frankliniella occidentalis]
MPVSMELVLIAFCRPSPCAAVCAAKQGRHHAGATMVPALAVAPSKVYHKHKHDILCGFDCLAELGLVLDLGLDASRCEDVCDEKQLRQLRQLPDRDDYKDGNNNDCKRVASWTQRPWDFPGGEHAISLAWEDLERFLYAMPALTSLVLDHNQLREDVDLPRMPRLRLLWLNHNQVRSVQPLVRRLQRQTPRLRHLLSMVWQLPQLEHLDERRVTEAERARSKHLQLRAIYNSCSRLPSSSAPALTPQPLRRNTCI